MIAPHDLIVVKILKDAFKFIRENPSHLEYILCGFNGNMKELLGEDYVSQSMKFVMAEDIEIIPGYPLDGYKNTSIAVVSYGRESDQFIGDYGKDTIMGNNNPIVYAEFDVSNISGDSLVIPAGCIKNGQIWNKQIFESGDRKFAAQVTFVEYFTDENGLYGANVTLDRKIPDNLYPRGWVSRSYGTSNAAVISTSMDDVTIECLLTVPGDPASIRILSMVARWAFKSHRLMFDRYGLQISTFSYGPPQLGDGTDNLFQQSFTMTAKCSDTWIENEYETTDKTGKIEVCMIASRFDGIEEGDVPLIEIGDDGTTV